MATNKSPWLLASFFAVLFSAAVFANYDPHTGRFLTRDPLGTEPSRSNSTNQVFNLFKQYTDGMNLYEYVHAKPNHSHDPYGLLSCNITYNKRNKKNSKILGVIDKPGHYWLGGIGLWDFGPDLEDIRRRYRNNDPDADFSLRDFEPCGALHPCNGISNWYDTDGRTYLGQVGDPSIQTENKEYGRLQRGRFAGKTACKCVTCPEIIECLTAVGKEWNNTPYDHYFRNCGTFVSDAMNKCCLRKKSQSSSGGSPYTGPEYEH